jgi:tRNA(His) 5'-end guanylyltransferase
MQALVSISFAVNTLYNTYWHQFISRDMMETDGENKFAGHLNENESTHHFLYSMFT